MGTFTANLIREEGDRYLQVAIALKLTKSDIEEKIKASRPEIMHRVNMLLQSKRPSDLATVEGRESLAQEIKEQIEYVIGLRKVAPVIGSAAPETVQGESAPSQTGPVKIRSDLAEVLFTSFIIQ
ncbi:MAG: flagellar basal body-associated FliL family protein [Nitrosomonadales bacterium]|nr:flagellar basal body-associated FliL family protein [Nitrosomonadales bacterium]